MRLPGLPVIGCDFQARSHRVEAAPHQTEERREARWPRTERGKSEIGNQQQGERQVERIRVGDDQGILARVDVQFRGPQTEFKKKPYARMKKALAMPRPAAKSVVRADRESRNIASGRGSMCTQYAHPIQPQQLLDGGHRQRVFQASAAGPAQAVDDAHTNRLKALRLRMDSRPNPRVTSIPHFGSN